MKKILVLGISSLIAISMLLACGDNNGGSGTNSDGSISLKFNFQKGTKYKYIVKNRQSITQEMMGKHITVDQDMDMESTYEVTGAEGSNKKLTVTYDRIAMKSNNSFKNMAYDSDDTAHSAPELRSLGDMVHRAFSMTVNEKGQIVQLDGFRELMPGSDDAPISDSSLRSMMQQAFYIYPDKPVKPGDTWNNSYSTSLGFMDLNTDNTYKLVSVKDGIAHIEMSSKITSHPANTGEAKEIKMDLNGVQTGGLDVDVASGLLIGSVLSQQIKGTFDFRDTKAPVEVTSDINVSGTKM
ncbi:MAG: hypothetical protein BGO69_19925 [Bacteroidetes bacterium 46-16]|nr:MAG: hypothetical protein BGO69_19925 [Bacteroidetes bacterium 46-16]